jgi:hypothetical protein
MAELPDPRAFDAASQHVTEDDIAALVPCGPDAGQYVKAVREYVQAGFTHVALVQVGAERSTTSSNGAPVSCSPRYASSEEPARPWPYRPAWVPPPPGETEPAGSAPGGQSAG